MTVVYDTISFTEDSTLRSRADYLSPLVGTDLPKADIGTTFATASSVVYASIPNKGAVDLDDLNGTNRTALW